MGMFDYIKINPAKLPTAIPEGMGYGWQTKDTPEQYLATYEITDDDELVLLSWDKDTSEYKRNVVLADYHGDLCFYTSHPKTDEWFEFVARFTEGKLSRIWRINDESEGGK